MNTDSMPELYRLLLLAVAEFDWLNSLKIERFERHYLVTLKYGNHGGHLAFAPEEVLARNSSADRTVQVLASRLRELAGMLIPKPNLMPLPSRF